MSSDLFDGIDEAAVRAAYGEHARTEFRSALAALAAAEKRLRQASWALPEIPNDAEEGSFVEVGYSRSESWDRDVIEVEAPDDDDYESLWLVAAGIVDVGLAPAGPVHSYSHGWSAISDEGAACWLEIGDLEYRVPDDMDWD